MTPAALVFVYGTLLTGGGNHARILAPAAARGGASLVGAARTGYGWHLHSLGAFPAMSRADDDDGRVLGEVFEVDARTLQELDWLEGIVPGGGRDGLYWRERVAVFLDGRRAPVCAWSYLQSPERQHGRPRIVSGSWRAYRADQERRRAEADELGAWLHARTSSRGAL